MWIIMKCWILVPQIKQRATEDEFPTKEEAEKKIKEIEHLFRGQILTAEEK